MSIDLKFDDDMKKPSANEAPVIPGVEPTESVKPAVVPGVENKTEEKPEGQFFQNKTANKILIVCGALIGVFIVVGVIATLL